jgi:predicted permease
MRWIYKLPLRLRSLLRKNRVEQELSDELRFHLENLIEEKVAAGITPEEARYAAMRELGGVEQIKEVCREMRRVNYIEHFLQDVRYGLRQLRRSPAFTAVAVLSLALGIGGNTSIFTLINGLLLKNLPVRDPHELVSFGKAEGGGALTGLGEGPLDLFSYEFYQQMREQKDVFKDVCAYGSQRVSVRVRVSGSTTADEAMGSLVSGNYFPLLGVDAGMGRTIAPTDDEGSGRSAVAVLSWHYWQQRFSGSRAVLGQTILVNSTPFNIIGVAPPEFFGETIRPDPPDLWMPLAMQPQVMLTPSLLNPHGMYWLHLIGRQKPGINLKQAREWVNLKFREYLIDQQGTHITEDDRHLIQQMYVDLVPAGRGVSSLRSEYSHPLEILMGVVALVLLIACANLANLLLAHTAAREKEISTRLALGAGRSRIVRQMLTEALLLSSFGGALGLLIAYWGTRALINFVAVGSTYIPLQSGPDARVLAFTVAVSLGTGLLFGIAPALRFSRNGLTPALKAGSRAVTGDAARVGGFPLSKVLVASQVALSMMLLAGAGLFVRTLHNLESQDFGFKRQNVLIVTMGLKTAGYKPEQLGPLYQRIFDTLHSLSGVRSASISMLPPMSGMTWGGPVSIQGRAPQPNENTDSSLNSVGPDYFETVGIPLLRGRSIGREDTATSPKVAVVNQTFATYFFPHGDAIGHHFSSGREIVGIVKDAKYNSPREPPQRMIYLPVLQLSGEDLYAKCLQIRTAGEPARVTAQVRRAFAAIDNNLPILNVIPLSGEVDRYLNREQLISGLSSFFAYLALLLASIGLYGVMSHNVVRRTNEIGIRVALGAQPGGVLWLILKESLLLLGVGVAIGVPVTLASTNLVRSQLFGLSPCDPFTLTAAIVCVTMVTVLAGYIPARRATRVDPMVALRWE